jgi:hypothetical protein
MWPWLKHHPKFFSIVGALIVLLTFSVKEGWRDSVRDQLQDLSNRHSSFALGINFDATAYNIFTLQSIEPAALTETINRDRMLSAVAGLERTRFMHDDRIDRLESLSKLFGADCTHCVRDCRVESKKMEKASYAVLEAALLDNTLTSKRTKDMYLQADRQQTNVKSAIERLIACVEKRYSTRRTQLNALLKNLTIASTLLYFIGGFISILGIVANPKK